MPEAPPSDPTPGALPRPGGTVLVLCGGDDPHPGLVLPPAELVVAADSGAAQAAALGVTVDVLVGDLDSVAPELVAALRRAGARVEEHHPDKDATDIELALATAVDARPAGIVVVGGHGGRLDHALATMGALAAATRPGRRVEAWMGAAQVVLVADRATVTGRVRELVSLVPLGGPVEGVTTEGLRWPLDRATLAFGSTWGVSNELTAPTAHVSVGAGTLAVVRPHALTPEADARPEVPDRPGPEGARP